MPGADTAGHILIVCEADRARSPVLAQLLRVEAERRGLGDRVRVDDAGLRATPGEPLLPSVERAVRQLGLGGLEQHRARLLVLRPEDDLDLVLTMTEQQRRELVRAESRLIHRTFTVREAVRLVSSSWWDPRWNGTPQPAVRLHRLRPLVRAARRPEDVADPAAGGRRLAVAVVDELVWCSVQIAVALWGPAPTAGRSQTSTVGR